MNLYITSDVVGLSNHGGGSVTHHESQALQELGPTEVWGREQLNKQYGELPQGEEPWVWDQKARGKLESTLFFSTLRLACFYAGTFSSTVQGLKENGVKTSYTAAAHDIDVSRREHERLGLPFSYPHLTDPELWSRYVAGYLAADVVVCPSQHSAACMRSFGAKNIEVIPHGVSLPDLPNPASSPALASFRLGYIGGYGPDKGVVYLLQAWKQLDYPNSVLVLAGRDSTSQWVQHLIKQYGGGNIICLGWVNNIADFYNQICCYVQPSACLLPGSPVFTKEGDVPIEKLNEGDEVLTSDGTYRRVISPTFRMYQGDLISVRTIGVGIGVAMTPRHRVLAIRCGAKDRAEYFRRKREVYDKVMSLRKKGWGSVRISKVVQGPHVQTMERWFRGAEPHDGHTGTLQSVAELVQERQPEWVFANSLEVGDVVLFPRAAQTTLVSSVSLPQKVKGVHGNSTKPLPKQIELDDDVLRFLGLYVAEGCADGESSIFCFHSDENDFAEVVERVAARLELTATRTKASDGGNGMSVRVGGMLLSTFLIHHFGRGAHNKKIPSWIAMLPEDQLVWFVRGAWEGDGSKWAFDVGKRTTTYSTVSKTLAYQMFCILVCLGYMPKLRAAKIGYEVGLAGNTSLDFAEFVLDRKLSVKRGTKGQRTAIDDNYYYMPVSSVTRLAYCGPVFNLEVQGNHNYCAPFVVHNSEGFGLEVLEAMAYGRTVICSTGAGACDVVPEGWRFESCNVEQLISQIEDARRLYTHHNLPRPEDQRAIAEQYSWDKIKTRYQQVWRNLLEPR